MNRNKWEYINFKDVFPIKMGKTPARADSSCWDERKYTSNKWVSIADITNNEGRSIVDTKEYISDSAAEKIFKVKKGSLLMSFKLSIGRMAFAGVDLYTNEAIIAIPPNDTYILKFLYFYLLSYDWSSLTEGSEKVKGATLNKTSIGLIKLPIVSLSEQQKIVDYLDHAFEKIDQLKKNAEQQLAEAKTLFQASLKSLLEPKEGWEEKTLKDVSVISGNYGLSVPSTTYNGIRYLRITDITEWGNLNDDKVSAELSCDVEQEVLEDGDILFARTGATVGKTLLYREEFGKCLFAGYLIRYRLNKELILPKYVFYITHSSTYYDWILKNQKAAAQPNISAKLYNKYLISYPSLSFQQAIVEKLDSLYNKVNQLQSNYDKIRKECDALKQAILKEVFE